MSGFGAMGNLLRFSTRNSLSESTRASAVLMLNQFLADAMDLYSQTKQAHWNVKGLQFYQLHELFDEMAGAVESYVDLVAERATALGGTARGTVRMSADGSRLAEYPEDAVNGRQHVEALVVRFAMLAATARANIDEAASIGDADTADVFTELSRGLDKHLWFLESHVTD